MVKRKKRGGQREINRWREKDKRKYKFLKKLKIAGHHELECSSLVSFFSLV